MACDNRNKLYDELLSTRDTLSEQARKLTALNEQIQREHQDLQVFSHSLSHDFSAPIRQANQAISLVIGDLGSKGFETTQEQNLLLEATKRLTTLTELIKGLLEFLTADASDQEHTSVDLNDVMAVAIDLQTVQGEQAVNVKMDALPSVLGNKSQLQLIFKNLIGNSVKYNENIPEIVITHTPSKADHCNTIAIKDNGIGMHQEHLNSIFEPFKRLHGQGKYQGSGLGLSIVQKLVHKHNGDITVKSTPGKGSVFTLTFPSLAIQKESH